MTVPCNRPPTTRGSSRLGEAPLLPAGLKHQGDPFLDELLDAAVFGRGDDPELPRDRRVDVGADVLLALAGDRSSRRRTSRACAGGATAPSTTSWTVSPLTIGRAGSPARPRFGACAGPGERNGVRIRYRCRCLRFRADPAILAVGRGGRS